MNIHDTLKEREKTHGNFRLHAIISQRFKNVLHDYDDAWEMLSPNQREALEMICHKMARIINGNPNIADHWIDIAGYATLVADSLAPKYGNTCNCKACREVASTITCGEDIKI